MKTKRITHQLITSVVKAIEEGLTNKDRALSMTFGETTFYKWITDAESAEDKDKDELTDYEKLCIKFVQSLKKARLRRQQKRIKALEGMPNPTGIIFLMKNEDPAKWNRQPYLIPNFEKLEAYMQAEYTQAELAAVRSAIMSAEERREAERHYDEDDNFTNDKRVDIKKVELG